jgi:hypothetical protein
VARRYRVGEDKVRGWIARGELRAINTTSQLCGRPRWTIPAEALAAFEQRRAGSPLPRTPGDAHTADSAAAAAFRRAMILLWTVTRTFEIARTVEGTSGEAIAARASLISRVKSQLGKPGSPSRRKAGWTPIQSAFDGFWRRRPDGGIELGMRWTLCAQVGIELPGVTDQHSLNELGIKYGVLQPNEGRLPKGKARIAVLTPELVAELMEGPDEE